MIQEDLNNYFRELGDYLRHVPAMERIAFLDFKRKEILSEIEDNPDLDIEDIRGKFYTPKKVAEQFCLEKNYKFRKILNDQSSWSFGKVLVYLFGIFSIFMISLVAITYYRFTPLIEIKDEKVRFLGGSLVFDDLDKLIGNLDIKVGEHSSFSDKLDLNSLKELDLIFTNARFNIKNSNSLELEYHCHTPNKPEITENNKTLTFDMNDSLGAWCSLSIPENIDIKMSGESGLLTIKKIRNNFDLKMKNGRVVFQPDEDTEYNFNLSIQDGSIAKFKNSNNQNAYRVKMDLEKGLIKE